jgi:enamine deaminase RidA (YjgF/YER057c/UK114 family)
LVYTAGMTPRENDILVAVGRVDAEVSLDEARRAAALSALRALSAAAEAAGGLHRIEKLLTLTLTVLVACTDEFTAHSQVADGASNALEDVLGTRGRGTRTACGVRSLPGGASVEVQLVAALH